MRHALFLVLALGLASCAGPESGSDAGEPISALSPVAVDAGGIEVTPLDAPTGPAAATPPAEGVTAIAEAALAEAGTEADEVDVSAATPSTPHPEARPAEPGAAVTEASVEPETAPGTPAEPPPPKSQPQIRCEAAGGVWGQSENQGGFLCQRLTRDGGQSCSKKSDCLGECLAPSRTCSPVAPLMGCNEVLDEKGRWVTLCLE